MVIQSFERKDQLIFASLVNLKLIGHPHRKMVSSEGHSLGPEKALCGASCCFCNQHILTAIYLEPRILLRDDYHKKKAYKDIATCLEIIQGAKT